MKLTKNILMNYIQILIALIFFYCGIGAALFILTFQFIFFIINYKKSENIKQLIILNINLLVSTILANIIWTMLFFIIISSGSDYMGLLLGYYITISGAVFVITGAIISVLLKLLLTKINKANGENVPEPK